MILPVLLLLGVIGAARAQQPDTQSATASVEELSAEIAALKAKTSTWDKVLAALPKISGYVQTGYEWSDNSSTFFIKRVRLNLAGAIAPKLDYRVQIEFASPKIVDAYLCYKPFDELNVSWANTSCLFRSRIPTMCRSDMSSSNTPFRCAN